MKSYLLALPLLLLPMAAAWADDDDFGLPRTMSLDAEPKLRQDPEDEKQRPDGALPLTPMEFFYKHSELEAGAMYTDYGSSLGLRSNLGFYMRYGLEIFPNFSLQLTYRYSDFTNTPATERVLAQALFVGAGLHVPLTDEFSLVGSAGVGPMWWNSSTAPGDIGFGVTGEIALTARLWEMLRFKAGVMLDGVSSKFHQVTSTWAFDLSYVAGFEIGM